MFTSYSFHVVPGLSLPVSGSPPGLQLFLLAG